MSDAAMTAPVTATTRTPLPTPVVIAVDGPAGSGKSSVSKETARRLGFGYLDTGAAYRSFGWWLAESGVDLADAGSVVAALDAFDYAIATDPTDYWVTVGSEDVTTAIREPRISAAASASARIPAVRQHMVDLFRSIIAAERRAGIVVEGRDITTVVAPDAPVRLLLTAAEEVRLARRSGELAGEDVATLAQALAARDRSDSQMVDFLNAAPGVEVVDSSLLDFEQTVAAVLALIDSRLSHRAGAVAATTDGATVAVADATASTEHEDLKP